MSPDEDYENSTGPILSPRGEMTPGSGGSGGGVCIKESSKEAGLGLVRG